MEATSIEEKGSTLGNNILYARQNNPVGITKPFKV